MKSKVSGIEHIGDCVHKVRFEDHLTQEQLAELSGTNQAFIQKIENGYSYRLKPIMLLSETLSGRAVKVVDGDLSMSWTAPGSDTRST